jgi:hypothetical protein
MGKCLGLGRVKKLYFIRIRLWFAHGQTKNQTFKSQDYPGVSQNYKNRLKLIKEITIWYLKKDKYRIRSCFYLYQSFSQNIYFQVRF